MRRTTYWKKLNLLSILLYCLLIISSCSGQSAQKQLLLSELKDKEIEREQISQKLSELQNQVTTYKKQLHSVEGKLANYERDVERYMTKNIAIVTALGIAGSGIEELENANLNKADRNTGGLKAMLSGMFILYNAEASMQVGKELAKAQIVVRDYKSEITEARDSLSKLQPVLDDKKSNISIINKKIGILHFPLDTLNSKNNTSMA